MVRQKRVSNSCKFNLLKSPPTITVLEGKSEIILFREVVRKFIKGTLFMLGGLYVTLTNKGIERESGGDSLTQRDSQLSADSTNSALRDVRE